MGLQQHYNRQQRLNKANKLTFTCNNFDGDNGCQGQNIFNPSTWSNRQWQTPPFGDPLYQNTYQDYNILVGYTQILYNSDRSVAQVNIITQTNPAIVTPDSKFTTYFVFDKSDPQQSNSFWVSKSNFTKLLSVSAFIENQSGQNVANLNLEDVDFIWNHPIVNQPSNFNKGQKGAIIELFGWPYAEIEKECVSIGKMGYLGVKVFPPQESILDYDHPESGELNPWFWMYQPVSYKLQSRMGTRAQLTSMINTCRQNNVRVYADAVVNHMAGNGNDMNPSHCSGGTTWGSKNSSAGSPFYTQGYQYQNNQYTNQRPGCEFPAVPYGPLDFHCQRSLNSWTDPLILNAGWLVNLVDLNSESDYVRQRIADYFTDLLSVGFSGFRIDAAKHISPDNLAAIFAKFKKNLGGGELPDDFITYLEVIIGGEKDLLMCNDQQHYSYGTYFQIQMFNAGLSNNDIGKIKIWSSDYPKEFPICGWWVIPSERYAIENDCHDDQFPGSSSRDMGDKGSVLVKEKNVQRHRQFEVQMFTRTDGNWQIKLLLSSYTFRESQGAYAPPDGNSDCSKCISDSCRQTCLKSMPYQPASNSNVCGYTCVDGNNNWIEGTWTRTHRDVSIINAMRQWMGLPIQSASNYGLPSNCS